MRALVVTAPVIAAACSGGGTWTRGAVVEIGAAIALRHGLTWIHMVPLSFDLGK